MRFVLGGGEYVMGIMGVPVPTSTTWGKVCDARRASRREKWGTGGCMGLRVVPSLRRTVGDGSLGKRPLVGGHRWWNVCDSA